MENTGTNASKLTAAQCDYFAVDGKVTICHATGSAKNPYRVLKVSDAACVDGHTSHATDYVAVNDPTCGGNGFLPPGAPCDARANEMYGDQSTGWPCLRWESTKLRSSERTGIVRPAR